jgi:hypothetical protein
MVFPAEGGEAVQEELVEFGREDRVHPQEPHARVGECRAFYGILLGHDDDLGRGKLQLLRRELVVVGELDAARGDPERGEQLEETRRVADALPPATVWRPRAENANSAGPSLVVAGSTRANRSAASRIANGRSPGTSSRTPPFTTTGIDRAQARDRSRAAAPRAAAGGCRSRARCPPTAISTSRASA